MRIVRLDELPKWSPWPARLLGLEPWDEQKRTPERVLEEYDGDKYADYLAYYNHGTEISIRDVRIHELGGEPDKEICVSVGDDLSITTVAKAQRRMDALLYSEMCSAITKAKTVVELGCGYGYNLRNLWENEQRPWYAGGELSPNAVKLSKSFTPRVVEFNFLDPEAYSFLDDFDAPIVVFTCHAVEQIPTNSVLLDALCARLDMISDVFHFEPVPYLYDDLSLLGLLRKRYSKMNGYNQNLGFDLVGAWGDRIKVVSRKPNVFGVNPLNPTSVIHWRFK